MIYTIRNQPAPNVENKNLDNFVFFFFIIIQILFCSGFNTNIAFTATMELLKFIYLLLF